MPQLELVPNVSEGRDPDALARIVEAFARPGVRVLDVDGSIAAHRTVLTLVGEAADLVEAAVAGVEAAVRHVDLRRHVGCHPRMGAVDVIPFVPLEGATTADAVEAATEAARRIGALGVPAYLYGEAARRPERRGLHEIRRGEFEGLPVRMKEEPPDFGPPDPHPSAGASAVGARFFLVAFNVTLETQDVKVARRIAARVREWSRVRRDESGRVVERVPGRLKEVRAVGWYVEDFEAAQVSTNLTDFRVTPPHVLVEAVREEAAALGVEVRGSELVGCVPLEALRLAGRAAGAAPDASDHALVEAAVASLGLDRVKPFDPAEKVLEWAIEAARRAS